MPRSTRRSNRNSGNDTTGVKVEVEHVEENEADSGANNGMSTYEKARLENIRKNQEMLRALGIDAAKMDLAPPAPPPSIRSRPKKRKLSQPRVPSRKSSRIRNIPAPNYNEEKLYQAVEVVAEYTDKDRFHELYGESYLNSLKIAHAVPTDVFAFAKRLAELDCTEKQCHKIIPSRVTSLCVLPYKMFQESDGKKENALAIALADKEGSFGIWYPDQKENAIRTKRGCRSNITRLMWMDANTLLASSYNGCIYSVDARTFAFTPIYHPRSSYDLSRRVYDFSFFSHDSNLGVVAHGDGVVCSIDYRIGGKASRTLDEYPTHVNKINSLNCNPSIDDSLTHLFATASLDRDVKIWDIRYMQKKDSEGLCIPVRTLSESALNCIHASWSPDGHKLVATCGDHFLRIYTDPHLPADDPEVQADDDINDTTGDAKDGDDDVEMSDSLIKTESKSEDKTEDTATRLSKFVTAGVQHDKAARIVSIRHNNHTGRWLSKFQANFLQDQPDVIVCGSMERPRMMEFFHTSGAKIMQLQSDELGSVQSLIDIQFRPSPASKTRGKRKKKNGSSKTSSDEWVVVGANSSGRVSFFR